jgi:hypothetical protein
VTQSNHVLDNLYFGMGGEYYVMGNFFMRGYEAIKLSPDFGYDIHVTNKYMVMSGRQTENINLYLQVKTRLVLPQASNTVVTFYVDKDSLTQMISDDSAFLVCVMMKGVIPFDSFNFDPLHTWDLNEFHDQQYDLDKSLYRDFEPYGYFWLSNNDLAYLQSNDFLGDYSRNGVNYKTLRYDFKFHGIVDNSDTPQVIGDSRRYLFSLTNDDYWSYDHSQLFL